MYYGIMTADAAAEIRPNTKAVCTHPTWGSPSSAIFWVPTSLVYVFDKMGVNDPKAGLTKAP